MISMSASEGRSFGFQMTAIGRIAATAGSGPTSVSRVVGPLRTAAGQLGCPHQSAYFESTKLVAVEVPKIRHVELGCSLTGRAFVGATQI